MSRVPAEMATVNVFVAERGNEFMRDIADVFVEAASELGRSAKVVTDRLPEVDGSINLVIAPHEFYVLADEPVAALKRAAAASVSICTEQPNTPWFHLSLDACQRGLLTFDINEHGTSALVEYGVNARRLPFGAVSSMTDEPAMWPARDIDMLFMGSLDPRRGSALAGLAPVLWSRRTELRLFPFDKPVTAATPGVVFGHEKYDLLRRAKVLVNIHRDRSTHLPPGTEQPAYFEWVRMVETMANGCVVITEPSEGHGPLVAGTHFISAEVDAMAETLDALLDDPDRLQAVSRAARRAVTGDLRLAASLAPALALIETTVLPRLERHVASGAHAKGTWRLREGGAQGRKRLGPFKPYAEVLSRAKHIVLGESEALRRLEAVHALLQHSTEQHIHRTVTPAYDAACEAAPARPEVSVLVTLYDYESLVADTLDSILASTDVSLEVIIVEDHATDNSREVAMDYLAAHPDVPMLLLAKDANEGLAAARNTGIAACRADLVMMMDADNLVYPTCLRSLADALAADPGASFAYAALEQFGADAGVVSAFAWNPDWLCAANYIDAQTMIRRSVLESLGGYRLGDPLVFGWEDWEMWLRIASRAQRGVLVAGMLGRYRVQAGSMIGLTNLSVDESLAHLRDLHPTLPWPRPPD